MVEFFTMIAILMAVLCGFLIDFSIETISTGEFKAVPKCIILSRFFFSFIIGLTGSPTAYYWVKNSLSHMTSWEPYLNVFLTFLLIELLIGSLLKSLIFKDKESSKNHKKTLFSKFKK